MKPESVLFISVNDRCYASYRYFAERLAEAVQKRGIRPVWCYLAKGSQESEDNWDRVLQEVLGKKYLAVVDFNSFLPKLSADGRNFITLFEAPFYNYILDHPLYHHAALSADAPEQHVICVDEAHARYVRAHYPRIAGVWAHSLPGTEGKHAGLPFSERREEILFCGTYEDPDRYYELMGTLPAPLKKECRTLAQRMLEEPERTMEELLADIQEGAVGGQAKRSARADNGAQAKTNVRADGGAVKAEGQTADGNFAARMQADFLADAYVRNYRRKQALLALIREKLPLAVYGHGYEAFPGVQSKGELSYGEYVDLLGKYRLTLHCMPGFTNGGHDRIANAMKNGAVCISDRNRYTRGHYELEKKMYIPYDTGNVEELIDNTRYYLEHAHEAKEISDAAREYGKDHETWDELAERLINEIQAWRHYENRTSGKLAQT